MRPRDYYFLEQLEQLSVAADRAAVAGEYDRAALISNLGSGYAPDYGLIMSAIVITTPPTALVFFMMQKQFVAGMTGSVK